MGLVNVKEIIAMAREAKTAALSFICIDYNTVYTVIKAAEQCNKPAIVMLLPEHTDKNSIMCQAAFLGMAKALAEQATVPIGIHLDHSYDADSVIAAIDVGMPSVMIDGSAFPLEENIAMTQKVMAYARERNVHVEGELGHVAMANVMGEKGTDLYTNVAECVRFCKETGVDCLTVSIGNGHGVYLEEPKLDFKRLDEINEAIDLPLVLHGGSGIPHEQLEIAFLKGVNKFNIGTEFLATYYKALEDYTEEQKVVVDHYKMLGVPHFVQERLMNYLVEKFKISKF